MKSSRRGFLAGLFGLAAASAAPPLDRYTPAAKPPTPPKKSDPQFNPVHYKGEMRWTNLDEFFQQESARMSKDIHAAVKKIR